MVSFYLFIFPVPVSVDRCVINSIASELAEFSGKQTNSLDYESSHGTLTPSLSHQALRGNQELVAHTGWLNTA